MVELREWLDARGRSPFGSWFARLDARAAASVAAALARLERGHHGNVKSVGEGVFEYRIDFGPGYRIYFGRHGDRLVILLGGGSKRRQGRDIEAARERWADYRRRRATR